MKLSHIVLVVILSVVTSFGVVKLAGDPSQESKKETAFERVMRTQTIRCGYIISPPFLSVDLKTGQKSGLAFDYMQAIGQELDIKIEWAEESGWGNFHEGLKSGRYDVMCVPLWESGTRAKMALFSTPLYDSNLSLFTRSDDTRFDEGIKSVNKENVTMATLEGDLSQTIRRQRYPLTKELALPSGIDDGQYFLNVATKKADVGFAFEYRMNVYNETAQIKLKLIDSTQPVRSYGTGLSVAHGEVGLKLMLDSASGALLKSGEAQTIISKYPGVSTPTAQDKTQGNP